MGKVYESIVGVMRDLVAEGIAKDRKNELQNYKFRGIDDVYNALCGLMSKHSLIMLPKCLKRDLTERTTRNGAVLFYVVVEMEFTFISALDGSSHVVGPMFGEAMDSSDKATNKAMSAAYKYAAIQSFCIPTEGDNDADASHPEVKGADKPAAEPKPSMPKATEPPKPEPKAKPEPKGKAAKSGKSFVMDEWLAQVAKETNVEKLQTLGANLNLAQGTKEIDAKQFESGIVTVLSRYIELKSFSEEEIGKKIAAWVERGALTGESRVELLNKLAAAFNPAS